MYVKIGPWLAVLFGVFAVFGLILHIIRWMALRKAARRDAGFAMLDEIERFHRQGAITDDEYRRARRAALGLTDRKAGRSDDGQTDEAGGASQ